MLEFTMPVQYRLQELGGLGMRLKHALLAVGVSENDLDKAVNNEDARQAHHAGALRLAREVTAAMSKVAEFRSETTDEQVAGREGTGA